MILNYFNFSFDVNPTTRHTVFSVVIGGFFYWTSLLCTNQASVQKCMSLKSIKKSNIALTASTLGKILHYSTFTNIKDGVKQSNKITI